MIELDLVAVLIEVFVEEDLLLRIDPVGWSTRRMDGWWLMGFADVLQDLVDGAASVMNAMMRIVAPQTGQASGKVS